MDDDYLKLKEKVEHRTSLNKNGKGKLTPYKKLIEQMDEDKIPLKDMQEYLLEKYNLAVSLNSLYLFIKKLKSNKIVKMELINGTNFVAAPLAQVKEKKPRAKNIVAPENATDKSNLKETTKKIVLNLPVRNIETGELIQVDTSQFKQEEYKFFYLNSFN